MLASIGYDVWLTNIRGNKYSQEHVKLNPKKDYEFWTFSWDHFAKYDLPAMVNYVKQITQKDKVYYVGHSQGTLQMWIKLSMEPAFQNNIKAFFGLGPVLFAKHIVWLCALDY